MSTETDASVIKTQVLYRDLSQAIPFSQVLGACYNSMNVIFYRGRETDEKLMPTETNTLVMDKNSAIRMVQ